MYRTCNPRHSPPLLKDYGHARHGYLPPPLQTYPPSTPSLLSTPSLHLAHTSSPLPHSTAPLYADGQLLETYRDRGTGGLHGRLSAQPHPCCIRGAYHIPAVGGAYFGILILHYF